MYFHLTDERHLINSTALTMLARIALPAIMGMLLCSCLSSVKDKETNSTSGAYNTSRTNNSNILSISVSSPLDNEIINTTTI
jgi:hypothetical protein